MNIQEKLYHRIHSLSNDVGSSKKKEGVMYHVPSSTGLMNPYGIGGGGQMRKRSKASSKIIENLDAEHLEM